MKIKRVYEKKEHWGLGCNDTPFQAHKISYIVSFKNGKRIKRQYYKFSDEKEVDRYSRVYYKHEHKIFYKQPLILQDNH